MSARTPKYSCAPPGARRKPTNTSSKISTMPRSVQTARSCLQPVGVGRAVEMRACARCRPATSRRARSRSGCSACSGLTSTQAMSRARAQHAQRVLGHVLQRVGLARRRRDCRRPAARRPTSRDRRRRSAPGASAACDSARAAPPASPPRCPTCGTTPRRGRRSRAAAARCRRPPGGRRRAPGRARATRSLPRVDALLVEVVAEHVDAVRAGQVVERVAVEIGDRDAGRRLQRTSRRAGAGARSG